ncbi:glutathione ABC transporter substrate-binding protein [Priestia flexa]|uniref:glutathione ABC transporter substrate-binding protein n=2 Tax=Bacillaceae TaxID=186817 RepID=UPI003D2ED200
MRKQMFIVLSFIFAVLLLQACSTGTTESQPSTQTTEGREGGTLKVVRATDATNLDPHFITDISSANIIYQKVYETLVGFDKDMKIIPGLAESWKQVDNVTWEFNLKKNVTFHDGTTFNAEAVKKTFDRLLDPDTKSPQREKLGMIKEIKVIDDYKIQFVLDAPYAPLLSILASNEGSIISPKVIDENPKSLTTTPIGTGPFKFESWKSGQSIKLVKNDSYSGEKPIIDGIEFLVVPEDSTRLAMVETGEAHINDQVPVTEIERIESSDALNLYRTDGLAVEYIGFNTAKEPFDNAKVRKALSMAIKREAIIDGVYNGVGTLANSSMSPKVFGYSQATKPYSYNPAKAKKLLEEEDMDNKLELTLITNDKKERVNLAEVVQSQLKGIGVKVNIQVMEYGTYINAINKGDHDLFVGGWGNATGDGDYNQYNLFHSNSHGSPGNHFYYDNKKVDELIVKARKEPNSETRKQLYEEVASIEIKDAVYVPIRNYEHLAVYSNQVKDFWLSPVNYLMVNQAIIE